MCDGQANLLVVG